MTHAKSTTIENRVAERNIEMAFELAQAALADPAVLSDILEGATLVLLPDANPELFVANIEIGISALQRGENVYFRHVPDPAALK